MIIEYTVLFSSDLRKRIAKAESETERNPTQAQIKAENYKKGKVNIDGLKISIENPKGSIRKGIDKGGKPWKIKMHNTYGYINGVKSVDGDDIDIFLSKDPSKGNVYIVDQVKPKTGKFDEHKIMYGYKDKKSAIKDYKANYSKDWKGLGKVTGVSKPSFLQFIKGKTIVNKPAHKFKELKEAELKYSWLGKKKDTRKRCFITGIAVDYNPYTGTISYMFPLSDSKKFTLDQIKSGEARKVLMDRIRSNEKVTNRRITKIEKIKYHGTNKQSRDQMVSKIFDIVYGKIN